MEGYRKGLTDCFFSICRHFILPTSGSRQVLEITETGNTRVKGQWLFQVEDLEIQLPGKAKG